MSLPTSQRMQNMPNKNCNPKPRITGRQFILKIIPIIIRYKKEEGIE